LPIKKQLKLNTVKTQSKLLPIYQNQSWSNHKNS
jgi:hypothetical protein